MNRLRMALGVATAGWVAASPAQEITLFQNENFAGPRFTANGSVDDLARVGFNDRATSVQVRSGSWQLCSDSYYRGQCVTLTPGSYSTLFGMGLNNSVSSLREVGWGGGGGGNGGGGNWGGGGSIVLFDSPGLTGRSFTLNQAMSNFDGTGFNDRARSALVNAGTWQLCADADFLSTCEVFGPGRHDNLGGVTGSVSSARPFATGGGGPGGGGPGGGGWGGGARVVLYEGSNFSGRSFLVDSDAVTDLQGTGFNDRASSIRVERGYWIFCTDANFMGECRTFGPGDYPSLSWFANRISSGRRISNDYPYNAPPRWGH